MRLFVNVFALKKKWGQNAGSLEIDEGPAMRKITEHVVEGDAANHQLEIQVVDEPGDGGANHRYEIWWETRLKYRTPLEIVFQKGPISVNGVNGVTNEALIAIVMDRLRGFQNGPFECDDNQLALEHCRIALKMLQLRTKERIERGVEGTHQK